MGSGVHELVAEYLQTAPPLAVAQFSPRSPSQCYWLGRERDDFWKRSWKTMSTSEDRWFEVWFSEGVDIRPYYLLVVVPDTARPGYFVVSDPQQNNRIVYEARDYETVRLWLNEDDYNVVEGRMFPDDGWPGPSSTI